MAYDYASIGFHTFDCLGWPVTGIPSGGDTFLIDEIALAVSGAAGTAAIAAAKMGLGVLSVGGVGRDLMGDWVLQRLSDFGVDASGIQRIAGAPTSSSIVLTRRDGVRPVLHLRGATANFTVDPALAERILTAKVVHFGGVGLMDAMDGAPNADLARRAKAAGATVTMDVYATSPDDMADVAAVLPHTDYFMPSDEEAMALTGRSDLDDAAKVFLDMGAACCIFTLGANGAFYRHRDGTSFRVPAFQIDVKCTCGCGDAFNAGFAVSLVRGFDAETAVRFAQATSALNATGLGSQAGVVDFDHTWRFMQETPTRQPAPVALAG